MRIFTTLVLSAMVLILTTSAFAGDDPFLWLEEVEGAKALEWVAEQSAATTKVLEARPEFASIRKQTLEILDSAGRIPYVGIRGDALYNFWQDEEHVRGIWRRTRF